MFNDGITGGGTILVDVGGQASISPTDAPIVGYVFDQRGLMFNLSLQGAKISRIER